MVKKETVRTMRDMVTFFRSELDAEMPLQIVQTFLEIALEEGQHIQGLAQVLSMSRSATSRNVALLGQYGKRGMTPMKLVHTVEDPQERRRKLVYLTSQGKALLERMEEKFGR